MALWSFVKRGLLCLAFSTTAVKVLPLCAPIPPIEDTVHSGLNVFPGAEYGRQDPKKALWYDKFQGAMLVHETLMKDPVAAKRFADFVALFAPIKNASVAEKARIVNLAVNGQIQYRADDPKDDRVDIWYTPSETLAANAGDCEDYALLKYYTLRALGVPAHRLYFASVDSMTGDKRNANHLLLAVDIGDQKEQYELLDSMTPDRAVRGLHFYGFFNETGAWSYLEKVTAPQKRIVAPLKIPNEEAILSLLQMLAVGGLTLVSMAGLGAAADLTPKRRAKPLANGMDSF